MSTQLLTRNLGVCSVCPLVKQRLLRSTGRLAIVNSRLSRRSVLVRAETQRRGGLGDEDIDVAVFRFTLGIPGFDDRLIPRVVGATIGALLVLNHVLGAQPTPDAQLRSEWLSALLATLCFLVPDIEERLREAMPGRGRAKAAESVEGASNCFFLEPSLPEAAKKELAWASFSLLKNTNCCGLLLAAGGRVLLARGALGSGVVRVGDAAASLAAMSTDFTAATSDGAAAAATPSLSAVASGAAPQLWLPERGAFGSAGGVGALAALPRGAQCLLAHHVAAAPPSPGAQGSSPKPAVLLVFSERPRALSERERAWVAAIADKLAPFV